ncbi:DNA recombination protein RmuC [Nocardioides dilutus]
MTTPLLLLLALAAGLAVGVLLGRQQSASRDERELARAREELANSRADAAEARTEAAEARTGAAEAEAMVAHAQAQVAKAVAERDGAVARAQEIAADREAMLDQFKVLSAQTAEQQGKSVNELTAHRLEATEQVLAPVRASLEQFQARLTQVEKERVAMTTALQAQVTAVRETGEAVRRETQTLVTALRKPQVRGAWGETTLRNVARLAGMVERCDFDLQVTGQSDGQTQRPDMVVHLAEGKHVVVDSKVPLSAFLDAAETADEHAKAAFLSSFAKHVRGHVDGLSGKQYWKAAGSPEFVVLFLPNEGFFSAALDQMPDLYEYAATRDVVIATPTTLIAMLRAISYGWKQAALAEDAAEVARLGRELYERLGVMGNRFDTLGRALDRTVKAYNETIGTVEGRVLPQARKMRDLKVADKELKSVDPVDRGVRQIQAPELVEDAARVEPMLSLWRTDPDLEELVAPEADSDRGQDGESAVGS